MSADFGDLAVPARRALAGAGFRKLADLARAGEAGLMALQGMGSKALTLLRGKLKRNGLPFKRG